MFSDTFFIDKKDKVDFLSNLYTREVMFEYMNELINNNIPFTFSILDIDNFKFINDNYGHQLGDVVIEDVAKQFLEFVKGKGVVGRYGGDEFIFVFENAVVYEERWQIGFDLLKSPRPIDHPELKNMNYSYTLGMSKFPDDAKTLDSVIELADKALYRGKQKGRNCFIIYLESKHKDINLKSSRDKSFSSMYLHASIFNTLTASNTLRQNIKEVMTFLGSNLMIDHLSIQSDDKLYFTYVHPLGHQYEIEPMKDSLIGSMINTKLRMFTENCTLTSHNRNTGLYQTMDKQHIYAAAYFEIKAYEKSFGYLRAETISLDTGRIWQRMDLDLLLCFCQQLALIMYYNELEFKDLRK